MRRLAPASLAACVLIFAPGAVAGTGTLSGKLAGGKLPAASSGRALVRAVHLPDGMIGGATTAGRSGSWKLAVDPGVYVPLASVVRADKAVVAAIAPVQRVREGRTTRTKVSLKRTRTPRRKRARRGARAAASSTPPFGVRAFNGTGPNSQLGRGLAEMLITDLTTTRSGDCEPTQVEVIRRDAILQEIALANSNLVDPRSRIRTDRLTEPEYYVQGTVATTEATTSWDLQIVDAQSGNVVGGDSGSANGLDIFNATPGIAQRLVDQLCGSDYLVHIEVNANVVAGPYFGSGLMTADVPARPVGPSPPTMWMGTKDVSFNALSYNAGVPDCIVAMGAHTGYAKVEIHPSSAPGMIELTWGGETFATNDMVCKGVSIPGSGLPIMPFQGTQPGLLMFPAGGGTQSVSGGLPAPGGGWVNNGVVTVTRLPRGSL